jgi:hypothetical protein
MEMLSGPRCYKTAQKQSVEMRKQYASSSLVGTLSPKEIKTLFLAPLLYHYPEEMMIPTTLRDKACLMMTAILGYHGENDQDISHLPTVNDYLKEFADFAEKDRKELQSTLFHNLWELSNLSVNDEDSIVKCAKEKLEKQIQELGWVSHYEVYRQEKKKEAVDRLWTTMDRAFWDAFQDSLRQQEFSLLEKTVIEVRDLMMEIPHPSLTDRGKPFLEDLFQGLEQNPWCEINEVHARNLFISLLQYLKECDSVAMEKVYESAKSDLVAWKDVAELVSKGFQSVYGLLVQLRAKIQVIRMQTSQPQL